MSPVAPSPAPTRAAGAHAALVACLGLIGICLLVYVLVEPRLRPAPAPRRLGPGPMSTVVVPDAVASPPARRRRVVVRVASPAARAVTRRPASASVPPRPQPAPTPPRPLVAPAVTPQRPAPVGPAPAAPSPVAPPRVVLEAPVLPSATAPIPVPAPSAAEAAPTTPEAERPGPSAIVAARRRLEDRRRAEDRRVQDRRRAARSRLDRPAGRTGGTPGPTR